MKQQASKKIKRLLPLFAISIFGTMAFSILIRVFEKKPITWGYLGFVFVFMIVMAGVAFIIEHLFGEWLRRNHLIKYGIIAIFFLILFLSSAFKFAHQLIAGKGIHWISAFVAVWCLIFVITFFRKVKKR